MNVASHDDLTDPEVKGDFPTILVAEDDKKLRCALVDGLRQKGYLVLEAPNRADALSFVRLHSRPIHLLMADRSMDGPTLAATLKQYRHELQVLFVTAHPEDSLQDVLAKVARLLKPPKDGALEP